MLSYRKVTSCCLYFSGHSGLVWEWSSQLLSQSAVKANRMCFLLQDVFSAGCVIAETFLDGKPLFDYAAVRAKSLQQGLLLLLLQSALMASHGVCGSATKNGA